MILGKYDYLIEKFEESLGEAGMKKTIIVMPVANEGDTMAGVLDEILALPYDNLFVYPVLDGYTKDNTEDIVKAYEAKTGRVKNCYYSDSHGVVSCYLYGFKCALADDGEQIIEMDGGGSHQPSEIPQFIEELDKGYDCVWGSRFCSGGGLEKDPLYRRMLSKGGTILSNLVLHTQLKDMTSGFEAFQRQILENMNFDAFLSTGHMYQTEMRYYCRNYKTIEVPIHYIGSASGLKLKSVTEALRILFQLKDNEKEVMKNKA
jgi:dolichol-phosphate mannosyltransferase